MTMLLLSMTLLLSVSSPCILVDGDRIQAVHLQSRVPDLQEIPDDTVFGFSPKLGVRRMIPGFEIAAFARRNGMKIVSAESVCVERPYTQLNEIEISKKLKEMMREVTSGTITSLDVVDFSRHQLPPGEIQLLRHGWSVNAISGEVLWKGFVMGEDRSRSPFWVKVKITIKKEVLLARHLLRPGEPISGEDVGVEQREVFLASRQISSDLQRIIGKVPFRVIREGEVLSDEMFLSPVEIQRGETVAVSILRNQMQMRLDAEAESSGRRGERVFLRNPLSGRRFEAKVTGIRKAVIEP